LTEAELADHGDLESAKAVLVGSGERATQALGRA
jgi:hypothetical protein